MKIVIETMILRKLTFIVFTDNTEHVQDETDSIAETEGDREMKREGEEEREGGAINLTSRYRDTFDSTSSCSWFTVLLYCHHSNIH